ncbi:MAG TPA: NrfD/PsrC family molybdoenzyme membrane anchor subunit [Thermodesulfobacteriota bacterium]|nr:NrfD/PsrC family molybdoenzyme membrane anchor subunit [Thermodesulfobacteriota bacterium]
MDGQLEIYWNWTVAVYLFVAGVSAGAYGISAFAYFFDREKYEKITRIGAYIAPFPLILGLLCLIADLERPAYFWKLLLTVKFTSVMSLGSWLLVVFSVFSFLHFYLWLPERYDLAHLLDRIPAKWDRVAAVRWIKSSDFLRRVRHENLPRNRAVVAGWGIPLSIGVAIYTGVLLGILNARPFWNNPILPFLFLFSAMKTGIAAISFAGWISKTSQKMTRDEIQANQFMTHTIDFTLMVFSLIAVVLFVLGMYFSPRSSTEAARLILGGGYSVPFWLFAVGAGIVFPLAVATYELVPHFFKGIHPREHRPWLAGVTASFVLLGGFVLRYVIVYAGQLTQVALS